MSKFIEETIEKELKRQNDGIELIASENYVSKRILNAAGSILTNKYAEGYPDKRYYGGCQYVDMIEKDAIDKACKLFNCKYANVQPHSGSQANFAAYKALMPNNTGTVLSLELNDGGHLTHGSKVSFSGQMYNFVHYCLNEAGTINYARLETLVNKYEPDVVLAGFSAYPYIIDFKEIRRIIDTHNEHSTKQTKFMVDMAHIAGLVAAQKYPNPTEYADVVTSTTHKTLRGPRGGLILTNNEELIKRINSAIFPYTQGGPLMHIIAAKDICFEEALTSDFKEYINNVLVNTKFACDTLDYLGATVSGTNTHLFLLNTLDSYGLTGLQAQNILEKIGITTNKNMLPHDKLKPNETSGLRIGFAAATTRGCTKEDARQIAIIIHETLSKSISQNVAKMRVKDITSRWKKINELEGAEL